MPTSRLQRLLTELHREIEQLQESSQDERKRLEALTGEIETALEQQDLDQHASLLASLQSKLGELEADYPTASGVVRRLMQALSDMGI